MPEIARKPGDGIFRIRSVGVKLTGDLSVYRVKGNNSLRLAVACAIVCCRIFFADAQDCSYARKIIDTLTSPQFSGRGYTANGHTLAAQFIAERFFEYGIGPCPNHFYFQNFRFNANTFPGSMELKINNRQLRAGTDFIVSAESKGLNGKFNLVKIENIAKQTASGKWEFKTCGRKDFLLIDDSTAVAGGIKDLVKILKDNNCFGASGMLQLSSTKLTMDMAIEEKNLLHLIVLKNCFDTAATSISVKIENSFKNIESQNVVAYIAGSRRADSFIVITAHYDHLGTLGRDVFFPGANDNASGIAMLLSLARHYASTTNPLPYSLVFIAFGGEEAGLIGSQFFVQYPFVDLKKIRFLLNLDIMGTGDEGIKVVNATEFKSEFDLLQSLNQGNGFLKSVQPRGKAANSDHYPFFEKGVPCFFIYTLGGISAYHDVMDRAETLPLTEFNDLEQLLKIFITSLMP